MACAAVQLYRQPTDPAFFGKGAWRWTCAVKTTCRRLTCRRADFTGLPNASRICKITPLRSRGNCLDSVVVRSRLGTSKGPWLCGCSGNYSLLIRGAPAALQGVNLRARLSPENGMPGRVPPAGHARAVSSAKALNPNGLRRPPPPGFLTGLAEVWKAALWRSARTAGYEVATWCLSAPMRIGSTWEQIGSQCRQSPRQMASVAGAVASPCAAPPPARP